jgi:uncharacterized membrane protein YkvA (DUF1232 family)
MRPKAKSTEPCLRSNQPNLTLFGLVSANLWKIDGRTITIDEYIEERRRDVNAAEICALQAFTNRLQDKLKELDRGEYPELREAVHLLLRIFESPGIHYTANPLPNWLAEVGFATGYLLERYDLIPDHLQDIGLADDVLILKRVIARNQSELHRILSEDSGSVGYGEDPGGSQ